MYVDLRPDRTRFVWLAVEGDRALAELEAFRVADDCWQGWVRYHVEDRHHIDWVPAERIRRGVWVEDHHSA